MNDAPANGGTTHAGESDGEAHNAIKRQKYVYPGWEDGNEKI